MVRFVWILLAVSIAYVSPHKAHAASDRIKLYSSKETITGQVTESSATVIAPARHTTALRYRRRGQCMLRRR